MHTEDEDIIRKFGDPESRQEAFKLLLQKYQQKVYWHVRRMVLNHEDADDIVQDIFIKIWRNLENFRQDSRLYTWIYRIATNECLTFLNKQKQKHQVRLDDVSAYLSENLNSDAYFSGDQIQKKLQQAILTLPDKQRLVFNMKYFEEMKFQEISDALGTSVGALKASYHLAVKKIEQFLLNND